MNIWSKVFIVLIVLLGVASIVWSAKELNVQRQYRDAIAKKEAEIAEKNEQIAKLTLSSNPTADITGRMPDELVVGELAAKVELMLRERNRAWFGCKPGTISPNNNNPAVPLTSVELTSTESLDARGIVYIFSEMVNVGDRGAFLGRFTIDGPVNNKPLTTNLTSVDVFNERELKQLEAAKSGTWAVYVSMPVELSDPANPDKPLLFSHLKEEELSKLPEDVRKMLLDNDRAARGFDYLVAGAYQQRILLNQTIDTLKRNIQDLEEAQVKLDAEIKKSTADKDFEKLRIDAMQAQYNTVQGVYSRTQALVDQMQREINTLQTQNEQMVDGIGTAQQKAVIAVEKKPE